MSRGLNPVLTPLVLVWRLMGGAQSIDLNANRAREVLGLRGNVTAGELRRAFREAAKRAHPDRPGGDAERFRQVVAAYRLLQGFQTKGDSGLNQPPARRPTGGETALSVPPLMALEGGRLDHQLPDGRRLRIKVPAGLRSGDVIRVGQTELPVLVRGQGDTLVRGDDLWITVAVDPLVLAQGGRVALETPLGRRIVWITKAAGERGLIRLVGQGLPARGRHRQGHLFLRLSASAQTTSAARTLLQRFAAAWAA